MSALDELWAIGDITLREDSLGRNERKYFMIVNLGVRADSEDYTRTELVIPLKKETYVALRAKQDAARPESFHRFHVEGTLKVETRTVCAN